MNDFENFSAQAKPMAMRYDGVFYRQQRQGLPPAQVLLTINYHTKHTSAEKTYVPGQEPTVRHEHREDKKETTIPQLLLSELLCPELAAMVLRPKLVSLNVERRRHKEVIESVVGCAQNIAAEIEAEGVRRGAAFPHIHVEIKSVSFKWKRSELEMEKERKMLMIKKMLKELRVGISGSNSCSICLEEFGEGIRSKFVVRMPCSHVFHEECVLSWLLKTPSCPLCRYDMSDFFY